MIGDRQFEEIRRLDSAGHRLEKYFADPQKWFAAAIKQCIDLGLQAMPKRWILDVGSRVPYFAAAAGLFGHDVLSIDRSDPLLERAAEILGHDFYGHDIFDPMPELPHGFDLIVCWHGLSAESLKKAAPVIDSLIRRLNPRGRLIIAFPADWQAGRWQLISRWRRLMRTKPRITKPGDYLEFQLR